RQQRALPNPNAFSRPSSATGSALRKKGLRLEIGEEYRVGEWVPFCSVAVDVARARMAEAFSVLRDVDVGLVEFSPVREVFSFGLGDNSLDGFPFTWVIPLGLVKQRSTSSGRALSGLGTRPNIQMGSSPPPGVGPVSMTISPQDPYQTSYLIPSKT
ncbi:hypothetical protein HID58_031762, partial [Brassica napus]